jgi:transposase
MRGVRKGFDRNCEVSCKSCFEKDRQIERLKEELRIIKGRQGYHARKAEGIRPELPFGENTPSSKIPNKRNSTEESQAKKGGAKFGHPGHGRAASDASTADDVVDLSKPGSCPSCHIELLDRDTRERTIVETVGMKAKEILYRCKRGICPGCLKIYSPALPRALYGNGVLAHAATLHYMHGMTYGKIEQMLGPNVKSSGLMEAFHRLGALCQQAIPSLIEQYRLAPVRHADETGWRSDGHSGYAWIFCTERLTLLQFRNTRAGAVAREILGEERLPGVLIVDRYGGYDRSNCKMQYCFAHLLRKVEMLESEFSDEKEVQAFASLFAPLLSEGMRLRAQSITDEQYYVRAAEIEAEIRKLVRSRFDHLGIQEIQEIFDRAHTRLYHWVKDRAVPAENNRAERELRPTVIARKVSFGSQSPRGCKTRSAIMSVLLTAKKRFPDKPPEVWLKEVLDRIAAHPKNGAEPLIQALA